MPHPSITAVAELDDVLRCDPGPLLRILGAGRHIWSPAPGRVALWRDDLDDDGAASLSPLVIGYWSAAMQQSQQLPYAVLPGGRCLVELFIASCGHGAAWIDDGRVVVDELSALTALDHWGETIRRTGEEYGADPDAIDRHAEAMTAFLMNAVVWE